MLTRIAVVPLAAALAVTGLALPASASGTANEVVYTKITDAGASVVIRDLGTKRTTTVLATTPDADYDYPELSPAGDKVVAAFDSFVGDVNVVGITVVNRDGSGRVDVTSYDGDATTSYDIDPTFSPDGQTILFTRVHATDPDDPATQDYTLMTVPVAGGTATAVPGGTGGAGGAYDPTDPTRIAFAKVTDPETGIGTLSTVKAGAVTSLGQTGKFPKYSPNGSTLAFTRSLSDSKDEVATMPAAGGAVTSLGAPGTVAFANVVGWMPDGESLVYDLLSSRGFEIWGVNPLDKRHGVVVPATSTTDASSGYAQGPAPTTVSEVGGPSTFVPVEPTRLLDTRDTNGGHPGAFTAGEKFALTLAGRELNGGGTIPTITSAVLNVTITAGTAATVIQVYPAPVTPVPPTSSLNTTKGGQTRANQVTVSVPTTGDAAGKVALLNGAGTAHLIVDITGYYVSGTGGALFGDVTPVRVLDTRTGLGAPKAPVGAGGTLDLKVTGGSVPADATAVTLNLTGTAPTRATNVKAYPTPASGNAVPNVSSLNLVTGETAPNLVTVKIGDGGRIRLQNANGSVQLIADIAGYYGGTGATSVYTAISPERFLDTRSGQGAAPILTTAGTGVDVLFSSYRGLPSTLDGLVLNVTGTSVTRATNVRAYPSGIAQPEVSNLNLVTGDTRANAVVATPGTNGRVRVLNANGDLHLIADLAGYFSTPAP